MLGLRKRAKFIALGGAQLSYLMRHGTHLRGLDTARTKAASRLAGTDAKPQANGTLKAGGASFQILRWGAGTGGPTFLEKVTDNHQEYELCRQIVGKPIQHTPMILGAYAYRTRFHIFMTEAEGTPEQFHSPNYNIEKLVQTAHDFGQSLTAATPDTYTPRSQTFPYLQAPWARAELVKRGVVLSTLDAALAATRNLPTHLNHNDLFYQNALVSGSGDITLIDLGGVTQTHLGGELRHLAFNGLKDADRLPLFETAVTHLAKITGQSRATLRTSALGQSGERMIERAINKTSAKFLDHVATQILAI